MDACGALSIALSLTLGPPPRTRTDSAAMLSFALVPYAHSRAAARSSGDPAADLVTLGRLPHRSPSNHHVVSRSVEATHWR